jgi:hypothetical protein
MDQSREIIEAVEIVNSPDEHTGEVDDGVASLVLALGNSVTAIWSNLPQEGQWRAVMCSAEDRLAR